MALTLNIGKDAAGDYFLVLANPDTAETFPMALFLSEDHASGFTLFMESQGYVALNLPSQAEIDTLFD